MPGMLSALREALFIPKALDIPEATSSERKTVRLIALGSTRCWIPRFRFAMVPTAMAVIVLVSAYVDSASLVIMFPLLVMSAVMSAVMVQGLSFSSHRGFPDGWSSAMQSVLRTLDSGGTSLPESLLSLRKFLSLEGLEEDVQHSLGSGATLGMLRIVRALEAAVPRKGYQANIAVGGEADELIYKVIGCAEHNLAEAARPMRIELETVNGMPKVRTAIPGPRSSGDA